MKPTVPKGRAVAAKAADQIEKVAQELWALEARLTAADETGADSEAGALAADLGCVLVDNLHPAIAALRRAAGAA